MRAWVCARSSSSLSHDGQPSVPSSTHSRAAPVWTLVRSRCALFLQVASGLVRLFSAGDATMFGLCSTTGRALWSVVAVRAPMARCAAHGRRSLPSSRLFIPLVLGLAPPWHSNALCACTWCAMQHQHVACGPQHALSAQPRTWVRVVGGGVPSSRCVAKGVGARSVSSLSH
eukprot:4783099-Alexandrium_andersonii.AAC.1